MKLYPGLLIFVLAFLLFGSSLGAGYASTNPKEKLIITGTGSCISAMRQMGEAFQKKYPDITVNVLPSIGSTGGINAVKERKIDIGLSSRPLTLKERRMGIIEEPYGRTPLIFGVQESNPTKGVTLTEIEDIYAGKRKTWPDGTPIRLILRPLRDSYSVYLATISPRLKSAAEKTHSLPGVFVGMTDQDAAAQIEKTPGSFGTTSASLVTSEKKRSRPS